MTIIKSLGDSSSAMGSDDSLTSTYVTIRSSKPEMELNNNKPVLKSNFELVKECDNFPYESDNKHYYSNIVSSFYSFCIGSGYSSAHDVPVYGFIPFWVVDKLDFFTVDKAYMRIFPNFAKFYQSLEDEGAEDDNEDIEDEDSFEEKPVKKPVDKDETMTDESRLINAQLVKLRRANAFKVLQGWRDELYPLLGCTKDIRVERAGAALFGIVTHGVHMTAYTTTPTGMKIWVPRRAASKQTYGGMLDNSVAGGISAGETAFESLVREAAEEASLPEDLVRKHAKACGSVSYFHIRDGRAGGETGLMQPEIEYVYDIELPADVVPKPGDSEVQEFYLWTVEEVQKALSEGQFKPNCALVIIDFFIRHGIINFENEKNLNEMVTRMHRKLPFPTSLP